MAFTPPLGAKAIPTSQGTLYQVKESRSFEKPFVIVGGQESIGTYDKRVQQAGTKQVSEEFTKEAWLVSPSGQVLSHTVFEIGGREKFGGKGYGTKYVEFYEQPVLEEQFDISGQPLKQVKTRITDVKGNTQTSTMDYVSGQFSMESTGYRNPDASRNKPVYVSVGKNIVDVSASGDGFGTYKGKGVEVNVKPVMGKLPGRDFLSVLGYEISETKEVVGRQLPSGEFTRGVTPRSAALLQSFERKQYAEAVSELEKTNVFSGSDIKNLRGINEPVFVNVLGERVNAGYLGQLAGGQDGIYNIQGTIGTDSNIPNANISKSFAERHFGQVGKDTDALFSFVGNAAFGPLIKANQPIVSIVKNTSDVGIPAFKEFTSWAFSPIVEANKPSARALSETTKGIVVPIADWLGSYSKGISKVGGIASVNIAEGIGFRFKEETTRIEEPSYEGVSFSRGPYVRKGPELLKQSVYDPDVQNVAITAAIGYAAQGMPGVSSLSASPRVQGFFRSFVPKATVLGVTGTGTAITGQKLIQEPSFEKFGNLLVFAVPFADVAIAKTGIPTIKNLYKSIATERRPIQEITTPEVLSGEVRFPKVPTKEAAFAAAEEARLPEIKGVKGGVEFASATNLEEMKIKDVFGEKYDIGGRGQKRRVDDPFTQFFSTSKRTSVSFLHEGRPGQQAYPESRLSWLPNFAVGEGNPAIIRSIGEPTSVPKAVLSKSVEYVSKGGYVFDPGSPLMVYYEGQMAKGKFFYAGGRSEAVDLPLGIGGSHELQFLGLGSPRFAKTERGFVRLQERATSIGEDSQSVFVDINTQKVYPKDQTISIGGMSRLPEGRIPKEMLKAQAEKGKDAFDISSAIRTKIIDVRSKIQQKKGYDVSVKLPAWFATRVNRAVVVPSILYEPVVVKNLPEVGTILSDESFASLLAEQKGYVSGKPVGTRLDVTKGTISKSKGLLTDEEFVELKAASEQQLGSISKGKGMLPSGKLTVYPAKVSLSSSPVSSKGVSNSFSRTAKSVSSQVWNSKSRVSYEKESSSILESVSGKSSSYINPIVSSSIVGSPVPSASMMPSVSKQPSLTSSDYTYYKVPGVPSLSYVPITPPGTPKSPPPTRIRYGSDDYGRTKKGFVVLLKRKGKFVRISKPLPYGKALKFGSERTLRSLGATFRLQPSGSTSEEDIRFEPNQKFFRDYIIRKGQRVKTEMQYVQKRGTRLTTPEERAEIGAARKSKMINDFFGIVQ